MKGSMKKLIYNFVKCSKCKYTLTNLYLEGYENERILEYTCFDCRPENEKFNYSPKRNIE